MSININLIGSLDINLYFLPAITVVYKTSLTWSNTSDNLFVPLFFGDIALPPAAAWTSCCVTYAD